MKGFVANIIFYLGGLYLLKAYYSKKKILIILNFHNFSKYNNYKVNRGSILETGYADNFEKQIQFLKNHFNFCYPEDFFNLSCSKGIKVLVTFDDGYKDNYDIALPVLCKHQASAIFFITTNYIGSGDWLWHDKVRFLISNNSTSLNIRERVLKQLNAGVHIPEKFQSEVEKKWSQVIPNIKKMMTWDEVFQILESGFIIGSHTSNHRPLFSIEIKDMENEIKSSIMEINDRLNYSCRHFAFPNGVYSDEAFDILNQNNIEYSYTTKHGVNSIKQNKNMLKRIGINPSDSIPILILKLLINR